MIYVKLFRKFIIKSPNISINKNGIGSTPMPKLFLASSKRSSFYKKREVVKYTTNFTTDYHSEFNLQKHREVVSPSMPLEINYTQQIHKMKHMSRIEKGFGEYDLIHKMSNTSCALHQAMCNKPKKKHPKNIQKS